MTNAIFVETIIARDSQSLYWLQHPFCTKSITHEFVYFAHLETRFDGSLGVFDLTLCVSVYNTVCNEEFFLKIIKKSMVYYYSQTCFVFVRLFLCVFCLCGIWKRTTSDKISSHLVFPILGMNFNALVKCCVKKLLFEPVYVGIVMYC